MAHYRKMVDELNAKAKAEKADTDVVAAMCDDRVRFRPDGVPYIVDSD